MHQSDYDYLTSLLASHADGLNQGIDHTPIMLDTYQGDAQLLHSLLQLSKYVQITLVPVKPSGDFTAVLRHDLMSHPTPQPLPPPRYHLWATGLLWCMGMLWWWHHRE